MKKCFLEFKNAILVSVSQYWYKQYGTVVLMNEFSDDIEDICIKETINGRLN